MSNDHDNGVSLLERDLQALRRSHEQHQAFRTELRLALERQAAGRPARGVRGEIWKTACRRRVALVSGAVAVASLAGSIFGLTQLTGSAQFAGPTPASAATVLRDAAASTLAAGEVGHYVYSFSVQPPAGSAGAALRRSPDPGADGTAPQGSSAEPIDAKQSTAGTVDVWIQGGSPLRSTQTVTMAPAPGAPEAPFGRFVQIGGATYGYDAMRNALTLPSEQNAAPAIVLPNEAYDGAGLAESIEQLAARGSRVVALAPQTLEGVPVDVIQADGVLDRPALRVTLYFDAQDDLLRGFDAASIDPSYAAPSWQVRLQTAITMGAASAPAGTFSLQPPAGTSRVALRPDKLALLSECAGSKPPTPAASLLAACQASSPGLTAEQLAATLARSAVVELRQGVADGVLSAAEASAAQGQLEAQLLHTVTAPGSPAPARSAGARSARR